MPLATASVILQNYTLDLMLLGTSASGASNRFVAKDILTVQSNAAIYDKDIVLRTSSTSETYLRAGLGISFDESGYKNQVVIAQDVTIASNVNTNVKVEPLLKPLSSGVTGTVLAPIRLQLTSVDTTNNIDSWYFIDLMPKIQGNSPFTQAKIKTTNLPADSPSVMVKESKLAFGNTVLTIANTNVIKTPINLFNTFVRVHIASVDSTNFVDSWRYIDFMPTIQGESPFTQSKLRVSNLARNTQSVVAPYSSLVFENINVSLTVSPEIFISFLDTINDGNSLFTEAVIETRKLPFDYSSITVPDSTFVFNNVPLATEVSIRPQITWVDEGVDVYIHSISTNNNIDTWRYIDFISNIDNGISPFTQVNLGVNRLPSNAPFVQIPDLVLTFNGINTSKSVPSELYISSIDTNNNNSLFTEVVVKTRKIPFDFSSVTIPDSTFTFGNVQPATNVNVKAKLVSVDENVEVYIDSINTNNNINTWRYIDFISNIDNGVSPFTQVSLGANIPSNTPFVQIPDSVLIFDGISTSKSVPPELYVSSVDTNNNGNILYTKVVVKTRKIPFDFSSITIPDSVFTFGNVQPTANVNAEARLSWVDEGVDVYIDSINTSNINTWRYIDFISDIDNGTSPFTQASIKVSRLPSNTPFVQIPDSVLTFDGISTSKSVPPELYVSFVGTNNFIDTWRFIDSMPTIQGSSPFTQVILKTRKIPFDTSSIAIPDSAFTFAGIQPSTDVSSIKNIFLSGGDTATVYYTGSPDTSLISVGLFNTFTAFVPTSPEYNGVAINQNSASIVYFNGAPNQVSVAVGSLFSYVTNFIDTWRFIDSMPTVESISPFTQAKITVTETPVEYNFVTILQSSLVFNNISAIESSVVVNRNSEAIIYFNGNPRTLPISIGLSSNPFPVSVPSLNDVKNILLSGSDTATIYFNGIPGTLPISVGLFNTFTAFVPTSPGYNGVIVNQNSTSIAYFDGAPGTVPISVGLSSTYAANLVDTWRFIDSMPTVEGISPFTQAKIIVTKTPVGYASVTVPQSSLIFNNITADETSVVVNRDSEAIIYFNGSPGTVSVFSGVFSNPFSVPVPSLNDVKNILLSGSDTATIYFNGVPGTLPISTGLFNTFTSFVRTSPGYDGAVINQNSTSIVYFDDVPGTVPISVGLFNSYVTNFIDTWRFIDSMPTVESISPFTQSKIKVTKTPVEYASVTVPQSSLTFNGLTALESSAIVNRNSEAIIYFNGSPRTLPISAGLTSSSFRVTVPPLSEIKNTVLSGNNIKRTVYFDGLPGTLPISTGLFNTFTAFVPPTPGYNGVFIARNSRTTVYFDGEPNTLPISTESSNTYVTGIFPFSAAQEMDLDEQEIQFYGTDPGITEIYFNGSPNTLPISAGSQTNYLTGPIPLCGIQAMDLSNQDTQIDTTTFQSGVKTDASVVRSARSYNVSGIALVGDEALEKIVKKANGLTPTSFEFVGDEVYAVATFPDGEKIEGAALITNLSLPGNQNEVKKYSFTLTFLGKKMSQILL